MSYFEALGRYTFYKQIADAQVVILKGINNGVTTLLDAQIFDIDKIMNYMCVAEKAQASLRIAVNEANIAAPICKMPRLHWD